MNEATSRRLDLAQRLAPAYVDNPKVEAVVVAGSVARGWADAYSDLEIDVFWNEPPTEAERQAIIDRVGGIDRMIWPYEQDEWSELYYVDGIKIEISQFLVETMERYLSETLDRFNPAAERQILIAAIQRALPLHGTALVRTWQARAAVYPNDLARAMVSQHLTFNGTWTMREMLAARDDLLLLYDLYCQTERQIVSILLGLNRLYLPHPKSKWLEHIVADMQIAPADLTLRLKQVFRLPPRSGIRLLQELVEETLDLIEVHMQEIDTTAARRQAGRPHR